MASETVSTLNGLIQTLKDGEDGFQAASTSVTDARVKAVFQEFSHQRSQLASELQREVQQLGGVVETEGTSSAALHRGWINLKSALGGGEKSILNEAERGEDQAVQAYEKALSEKLSPEVESVVRRQYSQVKQAHDRVKALRDSWKK